MELELSEATLATIDAQSAAAHPEECCGFVIADAAGERPLPIDNVQNAMHAADSERHPRSAKTAYFMDPKQLLAANRAWEAPGGRLVAVYHSHPEHEAYFSDEDKARAMAWDEPIYPGAAYLVVSVYGGEVRARKAFAWDEAARDFVEVPIRVV